MRRLACASAPSDQRHLSFRSLNTYRNAVPKSPRDQNLYFEILIVRIKESFTFIIYNHPPHKHYRFKYFKTKHVFCVRKINVSLRRLFYKHKNKCLMGIIDYNHFGGGGGGVILCYFCLFCDAFVHICLLRPCGHLLGKG